MRLPVLSTRRGSWLSGAICAGLLAAPVGAGAQQAIDQAKPFAMFSTSAMTLRDSVVSMARAQLGKKYKTGGTTPDHGFDCSGLVQYVLEALRVDVPRTSREQAKVGSSIARDTNVLRPGDLLMFGKAKSGVSHVGIYVGDGRYIHASSVAGRVIESPLDRPPSPLIKILMSARRILKLDDSAAVTTPAASLATAAKSKQP